MNRPSRALKTKLKVMVMGRTEMRMATVAPREAGRKAVPPAKPATTLIILATSLLLARRISNSLPPWAFAQLMS